MLGSGHKSEDGPDDRLNGGAGGPDEENPTPGGSNREDLARLGTNDALQKEQQQVRSAFRASMRAKYLAKKG